jgi:hypothetical protein
MNFTKTIFALAIGSVGIMGAMSASAATLTNGSTLSIVGASSSSAALDSSVSWFAMDNSGDSKIQAGEKVALQMGSTGIVIGAPQTGLTAINAPWSFFSATGYNYTPVTGITQTSATTLDMSGWTVNWNGGDINMGSTSWVPLNAAAAGMATSGYASGVGVLNWDGNSGSTYTLDYTAVVPSGGFQGVHYALHLTGVATVAAVPEASTYGMMLAGLGLVGFAVRRRKSI